MSLPTEIKKREDRQGYWTNYYCPARRQKQWKKLANTMPLARRALRKLQQELTLGVNDKSFETITLSEYYNRHYKSDFLSDSGSQSWAGKQRLHIEQFIMPTFGSRLLDRLTLYDVQAWYNELCTKHPRKYANHIAGTLKRMMTRAEGRFILVNPVRKLKLLKPQRRIPDTLTTEQVGQIAENLSGRDKMFFIL